MNFNYLISTTISLPIALGPLVLRSSLICYKTNSDWKWIYIHGHLVHFSLKKYIRYLNSLFNLIQLCAQTNTTQSVNSIWFAVIDPLGTLTIATLRLMLPFKECFHQCYNCCFINQSRSYLGNYIFTSITPLPATLNFRKNLPEHNHLDALILFQFYSVYFVKLLNLPKSLWGNFLYSGLKR